MGKKVTRASMKVTKNVGKKQLVHRLIKVLRPKVYITDSSSFKCLVQQLTGNQTVLSSLKQTVDHVLPVAAIENSSEPCSSDSSNDSVETCNQLWFSPNNQEAERTSNNTYSDGLIHEYMSTEQEGSLGYSDVESWLLGAEPHPQGQHELPNIGIYDYEISAALMSELL